MKANQTKYILLSCVVILIVACLCLAVILVGGVGVSLIWPIQFPEQQTQPTPISEQYVPTEETKESIPTQENELPDELADAISQIESQVSQIRGLSMRTPIQRTLISKDELEQIVINDFFAEYSEEDARQDSLIFATLGVLPENFDLKGFYQSLFSEQIAGFYDEETGEIYVVQGEGFDGSEKLTYSHEFTHVLQDQVYGFEEGLGLNEDACEGDSERCAAVQALIEGDASLTEVLWFQTYATREDYNDLIQTFDQLESPILDAAPPFVAADLMFPYDKGLTFVQYLYDLGGFEFVNQAYMDLPLSTEQILHPERYPVDKPQSVILPDLSETLGEGWSRYDQNVMGEWSLFLILNKPYNERFALSERRAADAAAGWGGDAYAFYINENTDEVTFVLDAVWDTSKDANEFADAFVRYADQRWEESETRILGHLTWTGEEAVATLVQDDERTVWVISSNAALVESILLELQ
jgi:hypothetical protein